MSPEYDALLLLSFGGPEGQDDVLPFLENVVRGRGVPRERLLEVAEHYSHFGGVSPINAQNRALLAAIRAELDLPVYWGNRNWHPLVEDTVATMRADGVRRALVFVTSAYTSYSGCRQYQDDLARARAAVGDGAPELDKLRHYFNHPGFVEPAADGVRAALRRPAGRAAGVHRALDPAVDGGLQRPGRAPLHRAAAGGVPAGGGGGPRAGRRVRRGLAVPVRAAVGALAGAGRQRPPGRARRGRRRRAVVVSPIGFVSDHVEVLWDLDEEAAATAAKLGLDYARAATVGTDPRFVRMVRQLVEERTAGAPKLALGPMGPSHDVCPLDCCPAPRRRP